MPQSQQLDLALERIAATGEQAEYRAEHEIDESKSHAGILPTHTNPCSRAEPEKWNPSGACSQGPAA